MRFDQPPRMRIDLLFRCTAVNPNAGVLGSGLVQAGVSGVLGAGGNGGNAGTGLGAGNGDGVMTGLAGPVASPARLAASRGRTECHSCMSGSADQRCRSLWQLLV